MSPEGYRLALLPGDGIGVEVMEQARRVLDSVGDATQVRWTFDEIDCGALYFLEHGRDWAEGSEELCLRADAILLGAIGWPAAQGRGTVLRPDGKMAGWSAIVGNRINLDLYANVRPVKLLPGVRQRISGRLAQVWRPENVDMVFIRENTEGLYSGIGGLLAPGGRGEVATDNRVITRRGSERVIRMAFETARARSGAPGDGQRRVTAVVKDNILHGCRFFVSVLEEIAPEYPDVAYEIVLVDAFSQWLLRNPEHYDVVVATNMFGDIVTEVGAMLQGGLGLAAAANIGDRHGMFEPVHGSAPRHAGQGRANPMAMITATAHALEWLGTRHDDHRLTTASTALRGAVEDVLVEGRVLTYDLVDGRRPAGTTEVTTAVIERLSERLDLRSLSGAW
ncbi:isocitrate/isopropylmalate dehydrogenase family protein [Kineosporia mesophila]|uniref:Isocitrate/isopropylmalate dehydrogenase family protein n=1 Tax=Kineosporia mesophila TaxID=566012 RepID=A0ABP6ZM65_9ACTN|nr:isocitrate/isopropylmalate dehydrogenase family protein [Kineosporia mesophila]MCD5349738.1 isocitrate/isopropylmalate dehydrogenase family protein [Kineosporia mesophila]